MHLHSKIALFSTKQVKYMVQLCYSLIHSTAILTDLVSLDDLPLKLLAPFECDFFDFFLMKKRTHQFNTLLFENVLSTMMWAR